MRDVHLPKYAGINRYADWMPLDVKAAYRYLTRPALGAVSFPKGWDREMTLSWGCDASQP